jgi:hypothetical protein
VFNNDALFEIRIPAVIVRECGRSSIPETPAIEPRGRGVLDTPHARGMTINVGLAAMAAQHKARSYCPHAAFSGRS